jgi:hypothetical protein
LKADLNLASHLGCIERGDNLRVVGVMVPLQGIMPSCLASP